MSRTRSTFFAAALLVSGCERGCKRVQSTSNPATELTGTDCSDGLARCVEDRVEVSRLAHLPSPCSGPNCTCPWQTVAECKDGCASEGTVVLADADAGARQLCKPRPGEAIARFPLPSEAPAPRVCTEQGVACIDGIVRRCDGPGLPERDHQVCIHGCNPGIAVDHGEAVIGDGAGAILCRRDDAERR